MSMPQTESDHIRYVREWCKARHVEDAEALSALDRGDGIFDVSAQGEKLDGFIAKHGLRDQVRRGEFDLVGQQRKVFFAFKR